ncbi:MAG: hypothetical protein U0326_25325 [Polyangiales bacterium]
MRVRTAFLTFAALAAAGCGDANSTTDAGPDVPLVSPDVDLDAPETLDSSIDRALPDATVDTASDITTDTPPSDIVTDTPVTPGACTQARGTGTAATDRWVEGSSMTTVTVLDPSACPRTYQLTATAPLRDGQPMNPRRVTERAGFSNVRTRNDLFDALYALAHDEARENSVSAIRDGSFNDGAGIDCPAGGCFETGRLWTYVWTRDTSYSVDLALGALDPTRARNSLEFKLSDRRGGGMPEVVQDTGTGGSYPVSTDRVVWALGATELLKHLDGDARTAFLGRAFEALRNTVDRDRVVIYDATDGLYRGEHSFLDWREQSYPAWTATDTSHIGMSKSLSTNVLHYAALAAVARMATERGDTASATRYQGFADALRTAIRTRFWDADARQFRAFTTTGLDPAPVRRWDLLGSALAVLHGVADDAQSRGVVETYPHAGRGGAPVLWPQQQQTAIYHNRAMWPFVTAYWLRAARQVRNDAAVNRGALAMMRAAALNLSNMENLEFVTGSPRVEEGATSGPVVNSQRQLWSVAGYLSLVHDVIFGVEVSAQGLRARPYITRELRNSLFANADSIVLNDYAYRGRRVTVVVNLPARGEGRAGAYAVGAVRLNGRDVGDAVLSTAMLSMSNTVEVTLTDTPEAAATIRDITDTSDWKALFGPRTPSITRVDTDPSTSRVRLAIDPGGETPADVRFNVYRMGTLVGRDLAGTTTSWIDPDLRDGASPEACYVVETYFVTSGNRSQRSQPACWWGRDGHLARSVLAYDFDHVGGTAASDHGRFHYENWGDAGHSLTVPYLRPDAAGDHLIQVIAGNGSGGFTTGVTCGVKRVRVQELPAGTDVATGYVLMPQAGDWDAWRGSSFVRARLDPTRAYRIVVDGDERAVNMSSFAHFERYTGGTGGRGGAFNRVNISEVRVLPLHGGFGAGATVPLDGTTDLDDFGADGRVTVGAPSADTDAVAMRFDDGYLYAAMRVGSLAMNDARPYVLYFETRSGTDAFAAPAARQGMTYLDQTPTVPFEAQWALLLRRRSDAGDGAGPYNGLFRWDGTRWTRALRMQEGREFWVSTDASRTLSVRLPRAQLGSPTRVRIAGHAVQGGGFYNAAVPATHQPWTAGRVTGFYEVELAPPTAARTWTPR